MPIARIPNKVLTLMQTEDKKMGKIVSLQKNLEWSTKEVLGGGNIAGLEMAGRVMEQQWSREIYCCEGFRSSSSAVSAARGVGESVSSDGGVGRGVFHSAVSCVSRKGTFSLSRKSRYLHRKGSENNGWGSK